MNELAPQEKIPAPRPAATRRDDIERLYLEGYPSDEIAAKLCIDGRVVGRNVREIKKRWRLAAVRQRHVLSLTQCASIYREAMQGWQRSQDAKRTTTEEHKDDDGRTVTRREEGPGDKTFLLAAVSALKTLRRLAAEQPVKAGPSDNDIRLAMLRVMEPRQVSDLTHKQMQEFQQAVAERRRNLDACRAEIESLRRQAGLAEDEPAEGPTQDQAEVPHDPPCDAAGDDRPVDVSEGLHPMCDSPSS